MQTEIEPTNRNHRILVLTLVILLTAGAVGGGVYYVMNQQAEKQNELLAKSQSEEKEKAEEKESKVAVAKEDVKVEKLKNCDFEPPLAWKRPGLMTEAEMADIRTKIAEPYFDYYNEDVQKVVSMVVERYAIGTEPSGYKYGADAVQKDAVIASWIFGNTPVLGYWYPECLGECTFSDTFRAEHPESVAAYEAAGGA